MTEHGNVALKTAAGNSLRFDAQFTQGTIVLDSGEGAVAPNPVQHLLASLAACVGMDVISLLRKKRQQVSAYEITMSAERSNEHPRRLVSVHLVHRVTGHGVQRAALEDSLRLSVEKYCSVHHTLRPDLPITNDIEILEQ